MSDKTSTSSAVKIEGIGKSYKIGKQRSGSLRETLTDLFAPGTKSKEEFWALKNVSFEVKKGEVIGIIGKNGAGKSTLLKVLSKITRPTEGRIEIDGRVASLLEVGTGFHPELTGRENIFLNGTILGMNRKEVREKFDEIVAFSGIEKFIDTPVKHYSSGMYVRLAFAVAAHLEPEILIIDEVLAVGDAEFQKKCLGKMQDVAGQGRTVLFVSHNMVAVQNLCNRGVVMEQGKATSFEKIEDAISYYLSDTSEQHSKAWEDPDRPGNEHVRLNSIDVSAGSGNNINIASGIDFKLSFENFLEASNIDVTIEVVNEQGITIFHVGVILTENRDSQLGHYNIGTHIPGNLLNSGRYAIHLIFGESSRRALWGVLSVLSFEVQNHSDTSKMDKTPGVIKPALEWKTSFSKTLNS